MGLAFPVSGGALGVVIPIGTEYGMKGKRWGATAEEPTKGYKYSGILGLVLGAVGIGVAAYSEARGTPKLSEDAKVGLGAFGGASLATGGSILVLDELRKKGEYQFEKSISLREKAGLESKALERIEEPVLPLVEEI